MSQGLVTTQHPSQLVSQGGPAIPTGLMSDNSGTISLRDLLRIAGRYHFMILAIVLVACTAVLVHQLTSPRLYRSTSHVQVELIDEVGANQADIQSRNSQRVFNSIRLHRSRSSAEQALDTLDLLNDSDFLLDLGPVEGSPEMIRQNATNKLLSMIDVTSDEGSDLIRIMVTSRTPELAAKIANQLPVSVGEVRNSMVNQRRNELVEELTAELEERSEAARVASQEAADFRRRNRMLVGAGGAEDLAQLNRIAASAASANSSRAGSAARASGVSAATRNTSTAQATSPALDQLERQRAQLVAEQSRLGSNLGPNHPDMVEVNSQIAAVEANIVTERDQAPS